MIGLFRDAPAHWRTLRLRETVTACSNGVWGGDPCGDAGDIVCVRVADFDRVRLRADLRHPTLRSVAPEQRCGRMLACGDLLLEKSGGGENQPVGAVVLYDSDAPAVPSNFMARMPVAPGFHPRYLCYLHAALFYLRVNCRSINQTTGIQNLHSTRYLSEKVRMPDLVEQREIAAYLDWNTGKADEITQNKERLQQLLREKRDALISRAVTGGPGAEHWRATRLKFIRSGALLYGASEPGVLEDRNAPRYIRITDLNDDGTLRDDTFQSLAESKARRYLLQDGDILLARSGATVGKALRYRAAWGPACFAGYLVRLRPDRRKVLPDYAYYYTQSHAFRRQVALCAVQSTIPNVSAERYGNFSISLPPLAEQEKIVRSLDQSIQKLNSALRLVKRQVLKWREYRQALTVAAITRGCRSARAEDSVLASAAKDGG
jgi:type I restriction enzyme S subunit